MKYSSEFKEQILKEVKETKNIIAVARKHDMPDSTIHTWLSKSHKSKPSSETFSEIKQLKKDLADQKLKNMILEDMLKKTHNLWAND